MSSCRTTQFRIGLISQTRGFAIPECAIDFGTTAASRHGVDGFVRVGAVYRGAASYLDRCPQVHIIGPCTNHRCLDRIEQRAQKQRLLIPRVAAASGTTLQVASSGTISRDVDDQPITFAGLGRIGKTKRRENICKRAQWSSPNRISSSPRYMTECPSSSTRRISSNRNMGDVEDAAALMKPPARMCCRNGRCPNV
jgi:hypothetical protein